MLTGKTRLENTALCGVVEPLVVSIFVLLAIFASPWFSWTENALSDLGMHGGAAVLFNFGLIVGGVLRSVFAARVWQTTGTGRTGRVGSLLLIFDAVSLSLIGVFPESAGALHLYVSVAFFALLALSLLTMGVAVILEAGELRRGLLTILLGVFSALVWIPKWGGAAIPEALAYLAGSVWLVTMGVRLLRRS